MKSFRINWKVQPIVGCVSDVLMKNCKKFIHYLFVVFSDQIC